MPDDAVSIRAVSIRSKRELAAELNRLVIAAERRAGGRGTLKRTALARKIGVSVSSLYAYLDGSTLPPTGTFDRLLDVLGVSGPERGRLGTARDALDVRRRLGKRPVAVPPGPRELPPDVYGFTGRADQLAELNDLLAAGHRLAALSGTGGVGKTALAVHWAHQVRDQFPDGQLYFNLRGYDPDKPVQPNEALGSFLRSLGVAGTDIPHELIDRAARFRTLLDGRQMLVVLDNASSADQVRDLLPGTPSCFTLITSRDSLTGLVARYGAGRINLDRLPPGDAVTLLRTLVGAVPVDAEPDAAVALAERCARLPLALRLTADLASLRQSTGLAELVTELDQYRLDMLDAGGDDRTAIRAVFSWSYQNLDVETARVFRLLGLHPGRDFDAYAVAALAAFGETELPTAQQLIDNLAHAHLVEPTGNGRYQLHDLLRIYAAELAGSDYEPAQRSARIRLLDYYLHAAATAVSLLFPHDRHNQPHVDAPPTPAPRFADTGDAMAWLETERTNLLAVASAAESPPDYPVRFANILWRYLLTRAHHGDALALYASALPAARLSADRSGEASVLVNTGIVTQRLGLVDEAIEHLRNALALAREIGDAASKGRALNALGVGYELQGHLPQAIEAHRQALTLARSLGDRTGVGNALNNLSTACAKSSQFAAAIDYLQQALTLAREIGDRGGEGYALGNLGIINRQLGNYSEAVDQLQQALAIARQIGDRAGEGHGLSALGLCYGYQQRTAIAIDHLTDALTVSRDIGDKALEAAVLNNLGQISLANADAEASLDYYQRALAVAEASGERLEQAQAHHGIGQAREALAK